MAAPGSLRGPPPKGGERSGADYGDGPAPNPPDAMAARGYPALREP